MSNANQIEVVTVPGPIVRKENCPNGKIRIVTHWIIKGEQTTDERFGYGFPTLEALKAEKRVADSNRVDLGICEERFSDGSSLFFGLRNSFD